MDSNNKQKTKNISNIHSIETFRLIEPITYFEWFVIFEEDYKEKLKKYGFR